MTKRDVRLVTFGKGGDTCYCTGGSTISGYGNPDRPHAAAGEDIPDGTPALDTRPATDTDAGFAWAVRGPMVSVELPDGGREDCPPVPEHMLGPGGLQGAFLGAAGLQAMHDAGGRPEPGPLDYVSVSEYVAGWRRHGARVGSYKGGVIAWE